MEGTLTMTLLCCFRSHLGFSFNGLTPRYVDVSVTRRLSYHATAIISRALVVLKSVVPRPLTFRACSDINGQPRSLLDLIVPHVHIPSSLSRS
ncbi:hypothetical protein T11_18281 [Trichinella zimbabwensis]|uniref:Uncharacterized protein n=1 Tax=Trichinella zimbabwensis TaxID=268475 RepID=A0A0V1I4P5_9BILA|nr:hypothetical protein T11_18281 [Trichinella zimbabwensis]